MRKTRDFHKRVVFITGILFLFAVGAGYAGDASSLTDALKGGTVSGTVGSYVEHTDIEADNSDHGWSGMYATVKYETLRWQRVKFGARFFAHTELWHHHDDDVTNLYDVDVESPYTLPELYLDYAFGDASSVRAGRWYHKKISHIDDAQSEGLYVTYNELPSVDLTVGSIRRFAEIDYDDAEDFGRSNRAQDLDHEGTYGAGSKPYLFFLEAKTKTFEHITFNPYAMYQEGYAGVYGMDIHYENKLDSPELTYGGDFYYYYVASEVFDTKNSSNFAVFPYVQKGPVTFTLGYAKFDNGSALNKPQWMRDYFTLLDQQKGYANPDSDKVFCKLALKLDKFKAHYAMGNNRYDFSSSEGDMAIEHELVFGYQWTKNIDTELRLFDIRYDDVNNKDYQRLESRVRFRF